MFDIVFSNGSKCLCTRIYLEQEPFHEEEKESSDHEKETEIAEKEENNSSDASSSSEDDVESVDEETKLMIEMGLPTSFCARRNVKLFEHSQKKKHRSKKPQAPCIESSNLTNLNEDNVVSSVPADTQLEKEIPWQKNKLWSDIDKSISSDFEDYWERYGESILLHNWTSVYMNDSSVAYDGTAFGDTVNNTNLISDEVSQKCVNINLEETNHNSVSQNSNSVESESTCEIVKETFSEYEGSNGKTKKDDVEINRLDSEISLSSENVSLLCDNTTDAFMSDNFRIDKDSIKSWDKEQWKNAWCNHVEVEINKLYESFKKYYYTYIEILEDESTVISPTEIDYKLEELKELKFVISEPHPISIRRKGYNCYPFIKWWKKRLECAYNLWNTHIAKTLGYEDEKETIEEIKSNCANKKELSSDQIANGIIEACNEEHLINPLPNDCDIDNDIQKYYVQRHLLFSLFHKGIKLDKESWYSVTPEKIAEHIAERCRCDVIIDAFCGAGGNAIQFAFTCNHVIAIDWDPVKIELAKHNAKIYGVEDRIDFICANFMDIGPSLKGDVIFLSPPWGGPEYQKMEGYDVTSIQPDIYKLFDICKAVTTNIAIYMPKSTYVNQLANLLNAEDYVEVEQNVLNKKLKAITTYFGFVFNDHYCDEEYY